MANAERDKIASELEQGLGPEFLSWRRSNGSQQAYIEGHTVIALANQIFGFDGWSSEVRSTAVEYEKASSDGRWQIGIRCVMRITLRKSGVYREDVGYGQAINIPSKLMALEKAHKEAATDATKRAFRQFGNAMGNCIYDKTHTNAVTSVNALKREFDPSTLRRPPQGPPTKKVAVPYKPSEPAAAPSHLPPVITGRELSTPTPASKLVLMSENDDDDIDFTALGSHTIGAQAAAPASAAATAPVVSAAEALPTADVDAVFVSADNAAAYDSPKPPPSDTHFNPDFRSPSIKTTLPQNYSAKVFRRS